MIEEVALSRGHEITCVIDRVAVGPSQSDCKTANAVGPALPVRYYSPEEGFESEAFRSADVAIEFTTPATAEANIRKAWEQGVPVVCGSTGWNVAFGNRCAMVDTAPLNRQATDASALPKNWKFSGTPNKIEVRNEEGKVMLVWSSNYSVGVNIFFDLNRFLAEKIREASPQPSPEGKGGYMPSIKEIHHIHKLDKPSGTAKTLSNDIMSAAKPLNGDATLNDVPIESIREGEVPGTHEVKWDSEEDTIIITHIAKGRRGFALGAVLAAEKIGIR